MTFATWLLLGLCAGYVPNDGELTLDLCRAQFQAEHRGIVLEDSFDHDQFYVSVSKVVWPRKEK